MRPRAMAIRGLYFRFIQGTDLEHILDAKSVFACLVRNGLIEPIDDWTYRDTDKLRDLGKTMYKATIREILKLEASYV